MLSIKSSYTTADLDTALPNQMLSPRPSMDYSKTGFISLRLW